MPPDAARIGDAIRALLAQRASDASICPSEVARTIGDADWRERMPEVRRIAGALARDGIILLTRGETVLDPDAPPGGPIRLRRGPRWQDDARDVHDGARVAQNAPMKTPAHADRPDAPPLPASPACERNRAPILDVLRVAFASRRHVLEIGSGTGQHAVHFAAAMPWLRWQSSDRPGQDLGLARRLALAALSNAPPPLDLDVAQGPWPVPASGAPRFDAAFTANTLHIMGWDAVEACFAGLGAVLGDDAVLVVYGPFNVGGAFTSDSNRDFDAMLRARDPQSGLRDLEAVDALAARIGLRLHADVAMPAHNRCLVWQRP